MAEAATDTTASLRCTPSGLWVRVEDDEVVVGLTDPAQEAFGPITYVGLPAVGAPVTFGMPFGYVQTAAFGLTHLFPPVQGEVVEVNDELWRRPGLLNEQPYEAGWILRLRLTNPAELDELVPLNHFLTVLREDRDSAGAGLPAEVLERSEPVLLIGERRQILAANPAAEALIGLSSTHLQHRPLCQELFGCRRDPDNYVMQCECPGLKAMAGGEVVEDEYTVTNAEGRSTTVKARYEPIIRPGRPRRALLILTPLSG